LLTIPRDRFARVRFTTSASLLRPRNGRGVTAAQRSGP